MRVYYSIEALRPELESISNAQFPLEIERQPSLQEVFDEFSRTRTDRTAIGFAPPEGFIDIGRYAISIISSDAFQAALAGRVAGSAVWEGLKAMYRILQTRRQTDPNSKTQQLLVVTDTYGIDGERRSMYFILDDSLDEAAFEEAVAKIPVVRSQTKDFLEVAVFGDLHDTVEFHYSFGLWRLSAYPGMRATKDKPGFGEKWKRRVEMFAIRTLIKLGSLFRRRPRANP